MSELIKVRKKAQVTLPHSVRKALKIEEGDFLDFRVSDSEIILRVKKLVDKEQAWFWTRRWQEGEREANDDIRSGRVHSFDSARKAITFLHKRVKKGSGSIKKA